LRLELVALPSAVGGGGYFRQLHVGLLLHTFSMGLSLSIHHQQTRNYFVPPSVYSSPDEPRDLH
jgi:hypothetical protein